MVRLYHGTLAHNIKKIKKEGLRSRSRRDEIFLSPEKGVAEHYGTVLALDVPESMVVRDFESYDKDPTKILVTPVLARTARRTIAPKFISSEDVL